MTARIRWGMVGGGSDAFIGGVHRIAARIDDRYELVAGALSSTPERAKASGAALGLDPARTYDDFDAMAKREARLRDGIEAVSIVTPNHVHAAAAIPFLRRGIHVICDKPLTSTLADAKKLARAVEKSDALFVLTHNYTGYPMVRQARAMVEAGDLGAIRVVQVEYPQDWLTTAVEGEGLKQAEWRTDPERSGAGGSVGDIGTHAYNLAGFVTGLRAERLAADLTAFVPGRKLDDNGHVMLRYEGGAKGMLWCSQVAPGSENGLRLRVYGERGGLDWAQEDPNYLWFTPHGEPKRLITRNGAGFTETLGARIPPGHPEGYLEGFANIYAQAADLIVAARGGAKPDNGLLPGIEAGLDGMAFVDACVRSSKRDAAWVAL
ncbi:Gfo/Idh/MocA family oxidoreductase [Jannaschia sp. LMIT008]|uniref:Gfo/Idh/MocA family protein n=1 Tax=Jannaschia maritima TaxID=3032585 RepID=UPI002812096E|nr:Gfo/Idh/MocA family oxidoreductase [Jannaschia sp. LMIT008]